MEREREASQAFKAQQELIVSESINKNKPEERPIERPTLRCPMRPPHPHPLLPFAFRLLLKVLLVPVDINHCTFEHYKKKKDNPRFLRKKKITQGQGRSLKSIIQITINIDGHRKHHQHVVKSLPWLVLSVSSFISSVLFFCFFLLLRKNRTRGTATGKQMWVFIFWHSLWL